MCQSGLVIFHAGSGIKDIGGILGSTIYYEFGQVRNIFDSFLISEMKIMITTSHNFCED